MSSTPSARAERASAERAARERRAELAYERALTAYAAGDRKVALDRMREAYALAPHPELLFNEARLQSEMGECREALSTYRRYLSATCDESARARALGAVRDLERRCGDRGEQVSYWTPARALGWSSIIASAATGAAAIYFVASSLSEGHDAERLARAQKPGSWDGPGPALVAASQRDAIIGGILSGATLAFAVSGVTLLMFGGRPATQKDASVTVSTGARAVAIVFRGAL